MKKKRYSIIFFIIALVFCVFISPSQAEYDKTRKMNAQARHYFDLGEYYKAIDIWAEALKIDSYNKQALEGIAEAQKILIEEEAEEARADREKMKTLTQQGKNFHRDREYQKALSCWGEALSIDPTNQELLDLIEEARIRAQYQISVVDKLDKESRLKTPHLGDLDKMADKMINLLEKVDAKARKQKKEEFAEAAKEEVVLVGKEKQEFIQATFDNGEKLFQEGKFEEAISAWDKILPYLPDSSNIALKIAEFKGEVAAEKEYKREAERAKADLSSGVKEGIFPFWVFGKQREKTEQKGQEIESKETGEPAEEEIKPAVGETAIYRLADRQKLFIFAIVILLTLLLVVRISATARAKLRLGKSPPKKVKKEDQFEPRDLNNFLNQKKEKGDKDLFK